MKKKEILWALVAVILGLSFTPGWAEEESPLPGAAPLSEPSLSSLTGGYATPGAWVGFSVGLTTGLVFNETNTVSMSTLTGSVNENSGMINLNQSSGNMNNQANLRALVLSSDVSEGSGALILGGYSTIFMNNRIHSIGATKQDLIEDSLKNDTGIMGINQSAGSLNNQRNTLIMAVGGAIPLTETELEDLRACNHIDQKDGQKADIIRNSFSGTQGIVQITQSAGDLNSLGNHLTLTYQEIHLR